MSRLDPPWGQVTSPIGRGQSIFHDVKCISRLGIISKERLSAFNCCVSPPFVPHLEPPKPGTVSGATLLLTPSLPPFSLVAGLTCYTCVNVSDNQVSTSPLNALPSLLRVRNACIVSGPTAISFNSSVPLSILFTLFSNSLHPPLLSNLHSLSRPCREGITDIGSTSEGETRRRGGFAAKDQPSKHISK